MRQFRHIVSHTRLKGERGRVLLTAVVPAEVSQEEQAQLWMGGGGRGSYPTNRPGELVHTQRSVSFSPHRQSRGKGKQGERGGREMENFPLHSKGISLSCLPEGD